jgi:hypothetical protein
MSHSDATTLRFHGANWEDLDRITALARFKFMQSEDYDEASARCAYLASFFEGPALDWAATIYGSAPQTFQDFDGFIIAVKQAFGVEANNITALRRKALDELRWSSDVPVFFADFDRITFQLGIVDHATKIAMVSAKLPLHLKELLATQALSFENYETMRERFNTMWALNPHKAIDSVPTRSTTKPARIKCSACGKKGHRAEVCRSKTKN